MGLQISGANLLNGGFGFILLDGKPLFQLLFGGVNGKVGVCRPSYGGGYKISVVRHFFHFYKDVVQGFQGVVNIQTAMAGGECNGTAPKKGLGFCVDKARLWAKFCARYFFPLDVFFGLTHAGYPASCKGEFLCVGGHGVICDGECVLIGHGVLYHGRAWQSRGNE